MEVGISSATSNNKNNNQTTGEVSRPIAIVDTVFVNTRHPRRRSSATEATPEVPLPTRSVSARTSRPPPVIHQANPPTNTNTTQNRHNRAADATAATMCTSNIYTYVYPDGHKSRETVPTLCSASRHNQPCSSNVVFQHPSQQITYSNTEFPPTPTYTPRSGTPQRSGDESDHRSERRRSGVYINGQKVYDLGGGRAGTISSSSSSRRNTNERIVLIDNQSRTPPKSHSSPLTAPSSPSAPPYVLEPSPRGSFSGSRRPVIVDDRYDERRPRSSSRVQVEFLDDAREGRHHSRGSHGRHPSTSSHDSRYHSHSEEESSRRRAERRAQDQERQSAELEARQARIRSRIAKANAEISMRAPVPVPTPPPTTARRASTYAQRAEELAGTMRELRLEDQRRQEQHQQAQDEEDEAQRRRLMDRMAPRRRSTVSSNSRRPRVLYDEGAYHWE